MPHRKINVGARAKARNARRGRKFQIQELGLSRVRAERIKRSEQLRRDPGQE